MPSKKGFKLEIADATKSEAVPPIRNRVEDGLHVASPLPLLDEITPDRTSPLGLEQYIAGRILVSGDSPAWTDMFVQVYSRHIKQEPFLVPAVAEPLIVWVMSGEAIVEERELDGEWVSNIVTVGDFFLTRSPTPYEMRWRATGPAPFQVMHLYLSVPLFERVAEVLSGDAPPALRDVSGGKDEQLSHLLALIHQELTAEGKGSQLFVQGLAQSLAVHLIRNYASSETDIGRQTALPGFKLRRAIAYLEGHLADPFNLAQLAGTVGMSEFHFSRLFKKATGLSPSRYFIRQRVAKAQQLLQETDTSIIEIGMSVGYSSPSHFAQVFRRETGLPPSHYRRG
ncbi:AraC family transcriptional regulator [Ensifer sp. Root1252]|nr:AraC family transcriptional regulator [Ensifer sp. Root1252]KQW68340.1 AraC family transcriptional regulator [Ensifer sp. Root127]KRC57319.1 AraC family transcriptional regulator [Ensifer sp. Root231]KRC87815.1 AraC family transcriptional regulator [Ensifer sp. Root258]NOV19878.1 AraC family transcriptional regulator [Ensifer canadensis]